MTTEKLKQRQEAGEAVEKAMIEFMIQFSPTMELKVVDIVQIASHARRIAFERFSEV